MKTSLAIVFAAAALMLNATIATAHFENYSGKSPGCHYFKTGPGAITYPAPPTGPRPLSWQSLAGL